MFFTKVGTACLFLLAHVEAGLVLNKMARGVDCISSAAGMKKAGEPLDRAAATLDDAGPPPKDNPQKLTLHDQCRELDHLAELVKLASNSTRFADVEARRNLTAEGATHLQNEIANATTRLDAMRSNSTLVSDCAILHAHEEFVKQCHEISHLSHLVRLGQNETALHDVEVQRKLSTKQSARLVNETVKAETRLSQLTANTTLTQMCGVYDAHIKLVSQCRRMTKLEQLSRFASNATLLDDFEARRNLTTMQVTRLEQEAQNATAELTNMQSNASLVADCQAMETADKSVMDNGKMKMLMLF